MLGHYGVAIGRRHARKHLGWALDTAAASPACRPQRKGRAAERAHRDRSGHRAAPPRRGVRYLRRRAGGARIPRRLPRPSNGWFLGPPHRAGTVFVLGQALPRRATFTSYCGPNPPHTLTAHRGMQGERCSVHSDGGINARDKDPAGFPYHGPRDRLLTAESSLASQRPSNARQARAGPRRGEGHWYYRINRANKHCWYLGVVDARANASAVAPVASTSTPPPRKGNVSRGAARSRSANRAFGNGGAGRGGAGAACANCRRAARHPSGRHRSVLERAGRRTFRKPKIWISKSRRR